MSSEQSSYSLQQWIGYKNFIKEQIPNVISIYEDSLRKKEEKKKQNEKQLILLSPKESMLKKLREANNQNICNINGIACRRFGNIIHYDNSEFDMLSSYIKGYYINSLYLFLNNKVNELKSVPSFTHIFQSNSQVNFLPYYLVFDNKASLIRDEDSHPNIVEFINDLYNGDYDETIYLFISDIETNPLTQHIPYIHSTTIDDILKGTQNRVLCSLNNMFNSEGEIIYHTIASVFWRDSDSTDIVCGVYDPTFYFRNYTGNRFFYALISFYINMKLLAKLKDVNIKIINLSNFCHTNQKGIHCPQYIIDAEYCNIYSVYFIYSYILRGCPRTDHGLRQVIRDCFIVEPSQLTRTISIPNNIFRVTMISFILTFLVLITLNPQFSDIRDENTKEQIMKMVEIYQRVKAVGINLLQPKLEVQLYKLLGSTGGSRLTRHRTKRRVRHKTYRINKRKYNHIK